MMNEVLEYSGRRLVIITDPHIKVDPAFRVYVMGQALEMKDDDEGVFWNVFIKNKQMTQYEGQSWPGLSVWIDFLNAGAHKYWKTLYKYDYFLGTSPIYGIWIDMNEPSVAKQEDGTMPKTSVHIMGDSWKVLHRDVHNIYGHLMGKATYEALIERD
jgi:alpha-glucosidase (family GH31 glycosyl hydrolase)